MFLADGPKAIEGALSVPGLVVEVFATATAAEQFAALLTGVDVAVVDDRAMSSLSDSTTPAGLVAVVRHLDVPVTDISGDLVAICADVRDPGNAGTVIRTADAAGAAGVVLAGDSVDAYNPKTVRASVGSLFQLPIAIERDARSAVRRLKSHGLQVLAADGGGEVDLFGADELLTRPTAWLFGNEAHGLSEELADLADHRVRIPILGRAESLNLSTAAALCLYASARAQH